MWLTIDAAVSLAVRQGSARADVLAAIQAGELRTDQPHGPGGPAMISLRDLEEWGSGETRR